jgi:hypothetical protein
MVTAADIKLLPYFNVSDRCPFRVACFELRAKKLNA